VLFLLGEGTDQTHARQLIERHGGIDVAQAALARVQADWDRTLAPCRCTRLTTHSIR
jgi:cellobiose phosphorylase